MSPTGSGAFCPRCGSAVPAPDERDLPGDPRGRSARLCDACYLADFELIDAPDGVVVTTCPSCGAVKRDDDPPWRDLPAEQDYTEIAVEQVRRQLGVHVDATAVEWGVEPEQIDRNTLRLRCRFDGQVRETAVQEQCTVEVRFAREQCDRCSAIAGGSYASTVQVRAADRQPTDDERRVAVEVADAVVTGREADGDREAYVTEVTEHASGVDVKLSTTQLGRAIARRIQRRLGGTVSDSRSLITEDDDGNEVYRVTYAVRLPPFPAGTVIRPESDASAGRSGATSATGANADATDPVLVRSARGNLKGRRLTTGERYEAAAEHGLAPPARRLGHVDDAVETTLVAVTDDRAVQVLDPETYETVTVPRPSYLDPDADTVYVLRHREGVHVLPPDAVEGESEADDTGLPADGHRETDIGEGHDRPPAPTDAGGERR